MQMFCCRIVAKLKKNNQFSIKALSFKKKNPKFYYLLKAEQKNTLIALINYFETFKNIRKYSRCIRNNSANRNFISVEILSALNIIVL